MIDGQNDARNAMEGNSSLLAPPASLFSRREPLFAGFLLGLVLLIYLPAIVSTGFIWDDDKYITANPALRSFIGLIAIWIHPTSIPQYYPVVHTTFWIEYHLWGLWPAGYHFDNVLLHGMAAVLLWRALSRLNIPAAGLAAIVFAVHPVQVESVAWATERKNVLSLVFYLLALHAYLRFTGSDLRSLSPQWRPYFLSLLFFALALLSKSVTCSLPAAILLLVCRRHGNLKWMDIKPLLPFFAMGLAMSLVTGMLERNHVGAAGRDWDISFAARCLIASRALWFYALKLAWPHPLIFIYPKWRTMNLAHQPWLIAFPLCAAAVITALFLLRHRIGRGPLVSLLFFGGTLLPALGFVNIYPMRYTFVADHFQYHASIGLIVLASVAISKIPGKWSIVASTAAVACLSILTLQQQSIYKSEIGLWNDTKEKNPAAWVAWGNLGDLYGRLASASGSAQQAEYNALAEVSYAKLLELAPDEPESHWRWGIVKEHQGDLLSARNEFAAAIAIQPRFEPAITSMGILFMRMNQRDAAIQQFRQALAINPRYAEAHFRYGEALEAAGDFDGAIDEYTTAVANQTIPSDAAFKLANLLVLQRHRPDLAISYYQWAVAQQPGRAEIHSNFAGALYEIGQLAEARKECHLALKLDPNLPQAQRMLKILGGY
ncbi:MAG: tetratricopeptide repeat protein [Planctomycetota bacterium]|nr:tetratricopeptide repeat protein [Planctomycetota bacterium]